MNTKLKKGLIVTGILFFIGAATVPAYYFYSKYQKVLGTQSTAAAQEELKKTLEAVGKLIELPAGEEPVLATVSDVEKLRNQPFFDKSQNGDKVLIYEKAKKAYIYRPSLNKLIEVTTLTTNTTQNTQVQPQEEKKIETKTEAAIVPGEKASEDKVEEKNQTPEDQTETPQQEPLKVVLRNGTSTVGITNKIETEINNLVKNLVVVDKDNAVRKDYDQTMVIALTSEAENAATTIATSFGTTVSQIPDNEDNPSDTDLLIIVGKDKVSN